MVGTLMKVLVITVMMKVGGLAMKTWSQQGWSRWWQWHYQVKVRTDFSRAWPWVSLYVKNTVPTISLTLQPALRNRFLAAGIFCSKFRNFNNINYTVFLPLGEKEIKGRRSSLSCSPLKLGEEETISGLKTWSSDKVKGTQVNGGADRKSVV